MINSILVDESKSFEKQLRDTNRFIDLNYEGINDRRSIILNDESAILNAYKMWLLSGRNDYIRNPGFGGFFDNNLNDRFPLRPSSEESVKSQLYQETEEKWPDINLLECNVAQDMARRQWIVKILIQDKNTKAIAVGDFNHVVPA